MSGSRPRGPSFSGPWTDIALIYNTTCCGFHPTMVFSLRWFISFRIFLVLLFRWILPSHFGVLRYTFYSHVKSIYILELPNRHAVKPVIVSAGYTTDRSTYNIWVVLNIRRCSFDPKTLGYLKYNFRTSGTLVGGSTSPPPPPSSDATTMAQAQMC